MDYLANSFNETQEIKRILFEYIVNQSGVNAVAKPKSKKRLPKENKSKSKAIKNTDSNTQVVIVNESDKKLLTNSTNDTKVVEEHQTNSRLVEVNSEINKEEIAEQKKLKTQMQLQQFEG